MPPKKLQSPKFQTPKYSGAATRRIFLEFGYLAFGIWSRHS